MAKKPYRPAELKRDHARPRTVPAPSAAAIEARLTALVSPATYALADQYRRLDLRERILTLPVMVSLLIALVWRQIPAVSELARLIGRESVLWSPPIRVSQQALNTRLRTLPPTLLRAVVHQVLPQLQVRARARHRPLPAVVARAQRHFSQVWAIDATTLEALFKKVGLLQDIPQTLLAGKLLGVLDVATRLPIELVWNENASVNERSLLHRVKALLPAGTLILLDQGFFGFPLFDWCSDHGHCFVIPDRESTVCTVVQVLAAGSRVRDEIIELGKHHSNPCHHRVRRIELQVGDKRYAYLTNVLDPQVLSAADVVDLYRQRWRIEEAFSLVKRLLGLSYLWTGARNGIQLQIWTTWLLYAILVDLADAVAEERTLPLQRISLEMVFRGLYHFVGAVQRGEASDPVAYLASQDDLGIVKRLPALSALARAIHDSRSPPLAS